jgi:thiamine biosynthesis lipoprotein
MTRFVFEAIGTHWEIDIIKELSSQEEALLLEKIMSRIGEFDKTYSRFREDSLVMEMSRNAGDYTLPDDADILLQTYKKIYDITFGAVTPLIGQVLIDAGYDHKYSLVPKELKTPPRWEDVLEWKKPILSMKKAEMLDFGAGGKGYLVDIISELLEREGITEYCVDAGGDMRQRGFNPLKVGLEHPDDTTKVIGTIDINNMSLCGSAGINLPTSRFKHIGQIRHWYSGRETDNTMQDSLSEVFIVKIKDAEIKKVKLDVSEYDADSLEEYDLKKIKAIKKKMNREIILELWKRYKKLK